MNIAKIEALAKHFGIESDEISFDGEYYGVGVEDFAVHTEEEREVAVTEYISQSLWAFKSSFLADMTDLPEETFKLLSEAYERSNAAISLLIEKTCGMEEFVDESTKSDGYGHFLSSYDGEEIELEGNLYAYKV